MVDSARLPQPDRILELFHRQQANRAAVKRTTAAQRIAKLQRLRDAIVAREPQLRDALYADFRKAPAEVEITEVIPVLFEIRDTVKRLRDWMKPHRAPTPVTLVGTKSSVYYEPRGVVLIIGPWNYPFHLVIAPLISAIAAGNCAIVKPSELTAATSALLAELIGSVFSDDEVAVVEGDAVETQKLLALPFDHFFFTGSTRVGRLVAEAAAKHLASTTLELGGKSPAVVDDSADLASTAKRLAWGKFINGGQTCIAPDYVMVSEARRGALVDHLRTAVGEIYGATDEDRRRSADLCRIINTRNFDRLKKLLDDTVAQGATIEMGGQTDPAERYFAPTILSGVRPDAPIMSEEIFGPILPILTYQSLDEVAPFISARDKPLAMYVFSNDERHTDKLLAETTAGGTCVNNTLLHFANGNLPFGGVGASGVGNYHGFYGFRTFSHERAVLRQGRLDISSQLYPPYGSRVTRVLSWLRRVLS